MTLRRGDDTSAAGARTGRLPGDGRVWLDRVAGVAARRAVRAKSTPLSLLCHQSVRRTPAPAADRRCTTPAGRIAGHAPVRSVGSQPSAPVRRRRYDPAEVAAAGPGRGDTRRRTRSMRTRTDTWKPIGRLRDGGDEVVIGAFARRQRRRRIAVACLGLGLIALAGALYVQLRPSGGSAVVDSYPAALRCSNCGFEAVRTASAAGPVPAECPECVAHAMRELWQCRKCDARFVPAGGARPVRCPECGSESVGSAAAP